MKVSFKDLNQAVRDHLEDFPYKDQVDEEFDLEYFIGEAFAANDDETGIRLNPLIEMFIAAGFYPSEIERYGDKPWEYRWVNMNFEPMNINQYNALTELVQCAYEPGENGLWEYFELGGDDDVDYHGGYLDTIIDAIDLYCNHNGIPTSENFIREPYNTRYHQEAEEKRLKWIEEHKEEEGGDQDENTTSAS